MDKLLECNLPTGIPFRFYKSIVGDTGFWAFIMNQKKSYFVPSLILAFHKGIIEGLQAKLFSKDDCGIYTSMIQTWLVFGMVPEFIYVNMETTKNGEAINTVANPFIQLRQKNEIGTFIGRVPLSLADSIVFSELLNTPLLFSPDAINSLCVNIDPNEKNINDHLLKTILNFESSIFKKDTKD